MKHTIQIDYELADKIVEVSMRESIDSLRADIKALKRRRKRKKLSVNLVGDLADFKAVLPALERVYEYYLGKKA